MRADKDKVETLETCSSGMAEKHAGQFVLTQIGISEICRYNAAMCSARWHLDFSIILCSVSASWWVVTLQEEMEASRFYVKMRLFDFKF